MCRRDGKIPLNDTNIHIYIHIKCGLRAGCGETALARGRAVSVAGRLSLVSRCESGSRVLAPLGVGRLWLCASRKRRARAPRAPRPCGTVCVRVCVLYTESETTERRSREHRPQLSRTFHPDTVLIELGSTNCTGISSNILSLGVRGSWPASKLNILVPPYIKFGRYWLSLCQLAVAARPQACRRAPG